MRKVLVLEDEENIRSFVVINLKRAGYETIEAGTGEEALAALKANPSIKVALLDIMLPGIDGFEVCRRIRAMDNKIGIIMLTARTQEMDKVTGLMTGADDYVTKPFSPAELTARVDALFRRTGGGEEEASPDEIVEAPFRLNTRNDGKYCGNDHQNSGNLQKFMSFHGKSSCYNKSYGSFLFFRRAFGPTFCAKCTTAVWHTSHYSVSRFDVA